MMNDFPVMNPTEEGLALLIRKHGVLRGLKVRRSGDVFVWPAGLSWHVPMADRLEASGKIKLGELLDRLVLDKAEDTWWLFRDQP
jgi:hypothetical protein